MYFRDSPAIENTVGGRTQNAYHRFNSRGQLVYRITHRLTEVVEFLSIHSPVEGSTDIGTEYPKLDVIQFVNHGVLTMVNPGYLIAAEEETYPDRGEKDADGAKNACGWYDGRELLREIQPIDGHIQRGENTALSRWSFGFVCHGRNTR